MTPICMPNAPEAAAGEPRKLVEPVVLWDASAQAQNEA